MSGFKMTPEYAEHINRIIDDAPPLTVEQVERISALLRTGAIAAGIID